MADFVRAARAGLALSPGVKVLKGNDYYAYVEAQGLVAEARGLAAQIEEDARLAYQEAKRRGYRDGAAQSKRDMAVQMVSAVAGAIDYLAGIEGELAELISTALAQLVGEFDDDALILNAVRRGLQAMCQQQSVTVRVAPRRAEYLRSRLLDAMPGAEFINVLPDERLQDRDCILESEIGVVDAGIDRQLDAIKEALNKRLRG